MLKLSLTPLETGLENSHLLKSPPWWTHPLVGVGGVGQSRTGNGVLLEKRPPFRYGGRVAADSDVEQRE